MSLSSLLDCWHEMKFMENLKKHITMLAPDARVFKKADQTNVKEQILAQHLVSLHVQEEIEKLKQEIEKLKLTLEKLLHSVKYMNYKKADQINVKEQIRTQQLVSLQGMFHDAPPPEPTTVKDPLSDPIFFNGAKARDIQLEQYKLKHQQAKKWYSRDLFTRLGYYIMTSLLVLRMIPQCQGEGHFIKTPMNTSALEGSMATFECAAEDVDIITFLLNSMFVRNVASIGVQESSPVYNGSLQTHLSLYIQATRDTDKWPVVCIAFLHNGNVTRLDSPPAYLHVKAPPSAPQNLTANITGATWVFLTWFPPIDTGLGGVLFYKVSYQYPNGTSHHVTNTSILYHNVTGLPPNTTYTITVMADNGISGNERNRTVLTNVTTNTIITPKDTIVNDATSAYPSLVVVVILVMVSIAGVMPEWW